MIADEDLESAREQLERAGLTQLVTSMLGPFTLDQLLEEIRTPLRLNRLRRAIWHAAYEMRDQSGRRIYSTPELGRLFDRDHTSILRGVKIHGREQTAQASQAAKR